MANLTTSVHRVPTNKMDQLSTVIIVEDATRPMAKVEPRRPVGAALIPGSNPYIQLSPVSPGKSPVEKMKKGFSRYGKKLEDSTRKAGLMAENVWYHLKTGPNMTDTIMTKITHGTKLLVEGGHEKIFQQVFGVLVGEKLRKAYACYLSTSSGPVIGTLYLSTSRIAFCSDNALPATSNPSAQQQWLYYKVVIQLDKLKGVKSSIGKQKNGEKYIQMVTKDDHDLWFMGFVHYEDALLNLKEAI